MSKVLEKLIASKRLPVVFIGSGLSKRYLEDFPSWEQLLDRLRASIGISKFSFNATKQKIKKDNPLMSKGKLNQKIATYLEDELLERIRRDQIDLSLILTKEEIEKCENEDINYFKMLVSHCTKSYQIKESKLEELKLLNKISGKISMVFTTNYDEFLEKEIFKDFKVYSSQTKYYFRTSNGFGELFKIHGSVDNPNNIILCEKDYEYFENNLKLVSAKLINALLDSPIIFLGYSLEDENIRNIITDFMNSFNEDILEEIKKYMVMVVYEQGQDDLIEGEKQFSDKGKSITLSTIRTDNFSKIYEYINKLTPTASVTDLRKYKTMIARLIHDESKGIKKIFVKDIEDADKEEMAIYIGSKLDISKINKSYSIFSNEEILKAILNNEIDDYDGLAKYWFEESKVTRTQYTAVFLIKKYMTINFDECCDKFKNNYYAKKSYFDNDYDYKKDNANTIEIINLRYEELNSNKNISRQRKADVISSLLITSLYYNKITNDACLNFIKKMLKDDDGYIKESSFKKAICYMWYKLYE